ncbi:hypothetical protein SteCoe_10103 [Stentor coeruleus]|uniref:Uncharacterized protein n=1 Tax=Stentor coeruleus TaxID=5963 RepID=A0A1R2CGA6_9CILI|nr:hypothetical protein SteCoe_10103 [Stentor coeruleus]
MTEEERRLAKLSKTINNQTIFSNSLGTINEYHYRSAVDNLQTALKKEKSANLEEKAKYNISVQAKQSEDTIKQLMYQHHSKVLEAQIREKELKKLMAKEFLHKKFEPVLPDPSSPKNFKLKDDILNQIKENSERKQKLKQDELKFGQELIENSKKDLDDEYIEKTQTHQAIYKNLKESWEQTIKVKNMKKELEKIRIYGPKVEPSIIKSPIEEVYEEQTPIKLQPRIVSQDKYKKLDKTYNWKTALRSSSVKTSQSPISNKSFNGVIERFSSLHTREKQIKKDKDKLLDYFRSKEQSRASSNIPKLPRL